MMITILGMIVLKPIINLDIFFEVLDYLFIKQT